MKKHNVILESNVEPKDNNVLWLQGNKLKKFGNAGWENIVEGDVVTTDRIENGAVTTDKIATTAFDSTLSVSGKIAPADVVGGKFTELSEEIGIIKGHYTSANDLIFDKSQIAAGSKIKVSFVLYHPTGKVMVCDADGKELKGFYITNGTTGQKYTFDSYVLPENYESVKIASLGNLDVEILVESLNPKHIAQSVAELKSQVSELEGEIVNVEKNVLELSIIYSRYIDNTGKLVFDASKRAYYITLTKGKTYEISVSSGKKVRFGVSNSIEPNVNLSNYNEVDEKVTVSADEQTDGLMLCVYCETEIPIISELIKRPIKEIVLKNVDTLKQYVDNIQILQEGQSEVEFSINGGTKIFSYSKSAEAGKTINCTTIAVGALPVEFNDFDVVDVQFDRSIVLPSANIVVYLLDNNGNAYISEIFVKNSNIRFIRNEQMMMCHYIGVYVSGSNIISSGVFSFTCTCSKESISDKIYDVSCRKEIVCFGDSLTAGSGSSDGRSYPLVLSELTNMDVVNAGVGGETSLQIATRQGALMLYCEPFTIPEDSTAVNIVLNSLEHDYSKDFSIIDHSEGSINPV